MPIETFSEAADAGPGEIPGRQAKAKGIFVAGSGEARVSGRGRHGRYSGVENIRAGYGSEKCGLRGDYTNLKHMF